MHWPECKFYGKEQFQFALVNSAYVKVWDSSNDYSTSQIPTAQELGLEPGKAAQFTDVVTMYVEGKQVWGVAPEDAPQPDYIAPDATQPATHDFSDDTTEKTDTTAAATDKPVTPAGDAVYGAVNCDETVDILDVIQLNKYLLGLDDLTDEGKANADVDLNKEVDTTDSLNILKFVVELVTLPVK